MLPASRSRSCNTFSRLVKMFKYIARQQRAQEQRGRELQRTCRCGRARRGLGSIGAPPTGVARCPSFDHANHSVLRTLGYRYGLPRAGTPRRSPNQLFQQISDRYEDGQPAAMATSHGHRDGHQPQPVPRGRRWFEEVDGGKRQCVLHRASGCWSLCVG